MKNSDEKLIPLLEMPSNPNKETNEHPYQIPLATISPVIYPCPESPNGQQQEQNQAVIEQKLKDLAEENNQSSPQSKLIKSSPHYLITYFFDQLYDFEFQMKPRAWVYHIIICVCAITLLKFMRDGVCSDIPMMQILFVALLINFGVNYYILRIGNILPYIEDSSQNQLAKLIGIAGLALIMLAILASHQQLFNIFFFSSWILAMIFEIIYYKFSINWKEIVFLILILMGTLFITLKDLFTRENAIEFSLLSVIGGVAASFLLTFFTIGLKQINKTNFLTTIHIILLMILIFLPIFFPFANIVPPTLLNWCFFILASVMTYLILILFIRSIQLQNPSKILLFLNLIFVAQIILELIQNKSTFSGLQYLGCIFIVIACLSISFVGENPDGMKEGQSFYFQSNPNGLPNSNSNDIEMEVKKSNQ